MAPNYSFSFYSIPAYYVVCAVPQAYAVYTMREANNKKWNNCNPRSVDTIAQYQKTVPAAVFAAFERAKAAHNNCLENYAMFIGAMLAGFMVRLDPATLNNTAGAVLLLRLAYNVAYISTTRNKYSYVRSVIFNICSILLLRIYVLAGNKVLSES